MKPKLLTTLPTYTGGLFLADAIAGITVAMVAIPLSIAIAIASGTDPAKGLITAIVGGFVISLLGGSRVQIGGPTGAFIVVVYGVIAQHGYDGLVLATLMAGAILLIAGLLRVGNLIAFVPEAVVNGFTIGIGVIIASGQLKDFMGLQAANLPAEFLPKMEALWHARATINWTACAAGAASLLLLVGLRRLFPRVPGPIFALALVSVVAMVLGLPIDTIFSRYGTLPSTLPVPALPTVSFARLMELLPSAFVIAFLAAIESLLSAIVADRMIEGSHRPNAEVLAQGWANIASALFGGLPATGAIARTATNVRAGGRTPVAGMVHAVTILIVMMLAAPLAGYLAMPALAALLLITAWNMSEPHKWRGYWSEPLADRLLLILTLVLTVLADLTVAIGVGVGLGLALRLRDGKLNAPEWHTPDR
ncbi:SulP family inorganic anion transporter [Novosphingobium album (ex Liu et al. 2023)]|uniref:SulP family inorganic anion transporter n=1 Tax=Novosphingobium album (ex Liu et al. 2023) TaxID=3031130 RepID=A0ABT5WP22_9SPHN|nr:SulP family inorganic anion transporter [Novosphingobium album (ex Liu et al. 2023)]MDE8651800.1 SulP family inorganic anion transporter [Novosphingobium album (ex Liu et al. 2023)]